MLVYQRVSLHSPPFLTGLSATRLWQLASYTSAMGVLDVTRRLHSGHVPTCSAQSAQKVLCPQSRTVSAAPTKQMQHVDFSCFFYFLQAVHQSIQEVLQGLIPWHGCQSLFQNRFLTSQQVEVGIAEAQLGIVPQVPCPVPVPVPTFAAQPPRFVAATAFQPR